MNPNSTKIRWHSLSNLGRFGVPITFLAASFFVSNLADTGPGDNANHLFFRLWVLHVFLVPAVLWTVPDPLSKPGNRPLRMFLADLGCLLAAYATCVALVVLWTKSVACDVMTVLLTGSGVTLLTAGAGTIESVFLGQRSGGLLTLILVVLLFWAPFCLEVVAENPGFHSHRATILDLTLKTSPTVLTSRGLERFDLYKQPRVYARFRIAEELMRFPAARTSATTFALVGSGIFGLSLVVVDRKRRRTVTTHSPTLEG